MLGGTTASGPRGLKSHKDLGFSLIIMWSNDNKVAVTTFNVQPTIICRSSNDNNCKVAVTTCIAIV